MSFTHRADDVDGTVIFDVKEEGERATWRSLISRRHASFCRLRPLLLSFYLLSCRFARLQVMWRCLPRAIFVDSRQNKRATWRSLIRAKKGDLRWTHSPQIVRWKSRAVIFDREARIRERRGALLFAQRRSVTYMPILSFCHLLVQVTWRKSSSWFCGDVARSRELDDGRPLTQEIIRSTARNALKRKVDISWSSRPFGLNFDDRLISPCSSHLHGWTLHRTPEVPENQSHPSDWGEALTPKSSPAPLWIFLSFGSLLTPGH